MTATEVHAELFVDGVPRRLIVLDIDHETIDVTTLSEFDPAWEHTDPAGHYHAWTHDRKLPTLRAVSEHVPCSGECGDSGCDGYNTTIRTCIACGARVKPGYRPTLGRRFTPGRKRWSVQAETSEASDIAHGQIVSVIIDYPGSRRLFGLATCIERSMEGDSDGVRTRFILSGNSPLGRRLR